MSVAPPRPKGPPLNSLRAFEAAARLGGFARAAEELCVTPGAVAQHIKSLEQWAGADLFERRSQGVRLTSAGSAVARAFSDAFDGVGRATQALRLAAAPNHVRIATLPSIAQLWLSPRLPMIRRAAAQISISVTAVERRPNMLREPFDISIFFEEAPVPGTRLLSEDVIFPVCAPELAARLRAPEDLRRETLLHDASWSDDWRRWRAAAGLGPEGAADGPSYSLYSLAVEEAQNGAGVLIGHEPLVRAALDAGRLAAPFGIRVSLGRWLALTPARPFGAGGAVDLLAAALSSATGVPA